MYIQISTRCNMECAHCCFSCKTKGIDMTMEIFKKALNLDEEYITIGGGEPTLHPNFWEIMGLTIGFCENPHIITNGKITETAIALAKLAQKEVISAGLSIDQFHESIDPKVVKAFKKGSYDSGYQYINSVSKIAKRGRGRNLFESDHHCVCDDFFVDPKGFVWTCGCKSFCLGQLGTTDEIILERPEEWEEYACINEWKKSKVKKIA